MKILLRVLGVLTVVIALFICVLGVVRNFGDAKEAALFETELANSKAQIEGLKQQSAAMTGESKAQMDITIQNAEKAMNDIPSKNTYTMAGVMIAILMVISLIAGVYLFIPKKKTGTILFVSAVIVAVIAIVISPNMPEGLTSGMSNQKVAIMAAVPSVLSALFAFLLCRMPKKNIANQ